MDLTASYDRVVPAPVRERYDWGEVRNAASVIAHTNPAEFGDLMTILDEFMIVLNRDIFPPGRNESLTAAYLNQQFRSGGWREGSYSVQVDSELTLLPYAPAGETVADVTTSKVSSPSYLVDNIKGRVALDVEWHAKDGNLDRDISAYRALYDTAVIDGAVIITMNRADLRALALSYNSATTKFQTSTTTNLEKVLPRLTRGDGGGCPILIVAVCARTV